MRRNLQRFLWLGIPILGVFLLSTALLGQSAPAAESSGPVLNDWSNHHLIFSKPATAEQAKRVEKDSRYWQQRFRSQLPAMAPAAERPALESRSILGARRGDGNQKLKRDWAESLGNGASAGPDIYPAKYSFSRTSANCGNATQPDFVAYSSGLLGSISQASIVAYDNIYSGCTGIVPQVYWAYNTSGQILTSALYSRDGTQLAFVQTDLGLEGNLVLLKWAASATEGAGNPGTPTLVLPAAYPTCTAPCMTVVLLTDPLGTPADDRTSSPFYDYGADVAYVGDSHGWLHKFTPVFKGTLTEVTTGWPIQVNPTNSTALTSPVHDPASGDVFVGDAGGFIYSVDAAGTVTTSGQLDYGTGLVDSPTVDSVAGLVYVFASSDGTVDCTGGTTACAAVYQLPVNFADGDFGTEVAVGNSVAFGTLPNPNPLYAGDFDSAYQNSGDATGNLYVCGNTAGVPIIYQVSIQGGVMGAVNIGPTLASGNPVCSPVTDVYNPNVTGVPEEWIFASTQTGGVGSACAAGGCIFNFVSLPWQPLTTYSLGQELLDSNFHTEVVETAGQSGATVPTWAIAAGGVTTDGTVKWLDQGHSSATPPAAWIHNQSYGLGAEILDSSNNIERATVRNGTTGNNPPMWNANVGGVTVDGTQHWTNLGALATSSLAAAGGAGGVISDNTVGTLPGASQVYFSTLSNQTCATSGTTGGCAVQASQPALK